VRDIPFLREDEEGEFVWGEGGPVGGDGKKGTGNGNVKERKGLWGRRFVTWECEVEVLLKCMWWMIHYIKFCWGCQLFKMHAKILILQKWGINPWFSTVPDYSRHSAKSWSRSTSPMWSVTAWNSFSPWACFLSIPQVLNVKSLGLMFAKYTKSKSIVNTRCRSREYFLNISWALSTWILEGQCMWWVIDCMKFYWGYQLFKLHVKILILHKWAINPWFSTHLIVGLPNIDFDFTHFYIWDVLLR